MAENSEKTAKARGRPFPPGKSGNPGGRPKVEAAFRDRARAVVDAKVLDAWESEVDSRGSGWLRASELLAAYGYGRPREEPDLSAEAWAKRAALAPELLSLLLTMCTDDHIMIEWDRRRTLKQAAADAGVSPPTHEQTN